MTPIGIGIVGCGDIARARFFPVVARATGFALRGLTSRTLGPCEPLARQYCGTIYPDLNALLGASEVQAVIIATPHPTHADLAIRCLEAGKHVLCEKPMATSISDAARIEEAVARSEKVFMALPFDRSPAVEEAKRLIDSGAIGRVTMADAALAHRGPKHAPWFFDVRQAHWGCLADLGVYLISELTYLFGPAQSVRGKVGTVFPERRDQDGKPIAATVDDNAAAVLELPDGILATVRANWCSPSDHRNVIRQTRIHGTSGMIFINLASKEDRLVVFSPERPVPGAAPGEYAGMTNCYRPTLTSLDDDLEIMRAFEAEIRAGKSRGNLSRARHVIEVIDRIYASSASGRAEAIRPPL
ncbi:MAG TPA: Gfo/Idh/MocA family oxidoreductase [Roseiarcus sp.]|nr:Gfo/Idh/MocA family oxidoreductase [Roseiarcus sp.]